ncbi:LuxR C-terminal-related transcriptional regulator [Azospirillum sp. sgz301742]
MLPDELQSLIILFYEAAARPELWQEALVRLADALDADEAVLNIWVGNTPLLVQTAGRRYGGDGLRDYQAHYGALDPSRLHTERAAEGVITNCVDYVPQDGVAKSEYYQDFLIPVGGRWVMGSKLFSADSALATVGIHRGLPDEAFASADMRQFALIAPHLRQAAVLHAKLNALETRAERAEAALNATPTGVIVVDGAGRILRTNAAAEILLRAADGVRVSAGLLAAAQPRETDVLRRMIRGAVAAVSGRSNSESPRGMTLSRAAGRRPLVIHVLSLPGSAAQRFALLAPAAMVTVTDPEAQPRPRESILQEAFRLTPAEARVAIRLAEGMEAKQIAVEHGVSIATVRTQIAAILSKTNTLRQTELVSLLVRLGSGR